MLGVARVPARQRSFGLLGTYPPTLCGIATFTRALLRSIAAAAPDDRVGVVRVLDAPQKQDGPEVAAHLRTDLSDTHVGAATELNGFDVAIVQHEYGIYGGPDGDQVLAVLEHLRVPVLTVTHTVLAQPTPRQEHVLRQVIDASDAVVAMTDAARARLIDRYDVDGALPETVEHGVTGFLVDDIDSAVAAGSRALALDRAVVAAAARRSFSADRMVDEYLTVYDTVLSMAQPAPAGSRHEAHVSVWPERYCRT